MKTLPSFSYPIGGGGGGLEEGLWRTFGGPLSTPLLEAYMIVSLILTMKSL